MSGTISKQVGQMSLGLENPTEGIPTESLQDSYIPFHETHKDLHVRCSLLVISL